MCVKMARLSIFFHGGVGEIGGNKFLINDEESNVRLYLDFGKNFNISRKYYEFPFTYPESIEELISIGAIPDLPSIYTSFKKEDFRKGISVEKEKETNLNAVIISHAHLDHYGHISLLNRRVPIYAGECAINIISAMNSLIYSKPSPEFFYDGLNLIPFRTGKKIYIESRVSEIEIDPIHVDHSVPGAYGFILHTSVGAIAYTGDFRMHGPQSSMTEDFIRSLEKEDIKILLTEGTHINYSGTLSEQDVFYKLLDLVKQARRGLVIVDFSRSDIDRFSTVLKTAVETNRILVISPKRYRILRAILSSSGIRTSNIDLESENIMILNESKRRLSTGEKEVLQEIPDDKKITFDDIKRNPDQYIFTVVFGGIKEIRNLKPPPGSIFILSSSEPVNEEREISFEKLLNWLEHFGVASYHIHSSGHATPLDIKSLIERSDPEIIVPIHTEHPKLFRRFIGNYKWFIPASIDSRLDIE